VRPRPASARSRAIEVADLALRRPTLDDVFLSLTGRAAEAADDDTEEVAA
jgi:ABC-2 type transport system ATP-binding protein